MYVWNYTRRTGWQLKRIGKLLLSSFEIWRQEKVGEPTMLEALDDYGAVIGIMAELEQSEKDRGATTIKHLTNPKFGVLNGFTVLTQQMVIVTDDGSGKPRYRMADAPSAHYWVEAVLPDQCDIENARYARKIGA
jgi:hypothetical protein